MTKTLKNSTLWNHYQLFFQIVKIVMHIYLILSDGLKQYLSENVQYYRVVLCILSTNDKIPPKLIIFDRNFHNFSIK